MRLKMNMKYMAMLLSVAAWMGLATSCFETGKKGVGPEDGGNGVGIDTAAVRRIDIMLALDSILADSVKEDGPAPADKEHTMKYLRDRVRGFYEAKDDATSCTESYMRLRALAKETMKERGETLEDWMEESHWTLSEKGNEPGEDWRYEIVGVDHITKCRAEVLVIVKEYYETKMKLHMVMERGDWYVDNFEMLTQTGFDATVQVYEEHEVTYNEREIMVDYIKSFLEE